MLAPTSCGPWFLRVGQIWRKFAFSLAVTGFEKITRCFQVFLSKSLPWRENSGGHMCLHIQSCDAFHSSSGLNTPEQSAWLWTWVCPRQALSWQSFQKVGNLLESKWDNAHINSLTVEFKSRPVQLSTKAEHLAFELKFLVPFRMRLSSIDSFWFPALRRSCVCYHLLKSWGQLLLNCPLLKSTAQDASSLTPFDSPNFPELAVVGTEAKWAGGLLIDSAGCDPKQSCQWTYFLLWAEVPLASLDSWEPNFICEQTQLDLTYLFWFLMPNNSIQRPMGQWILPCVSLAGENSQPFALQPTQGPLSCALAMGKVKGWGSMVYIPLMHEGCFLVKVNVWWF